MALELKDGVRDREDKILEKISVIQRYTNEEQIKLEDSSD